VVDTYDSLTGGFFLFFLFFIINNNNKLYLEVI